MNPDLAHPVFPVSFAVIPPYVVVYSAILLLILVVGVFLICALYFENRRREMWHQTARFALEKGQPLPALGADDRPGKSRPSHEKENDFRTGLIMIATGTGIFFAFREFLGHGLAFLGFIPGLIGVALFINGIIVAILRDKKTHDDDRRPSS
ncbi:MAG TPA: DUF6249 domain-containing protein [Opitutaceae bacterium]|nr:DUF6249 domain-containing protein [Opitutaceae bacterium]